MKRVTISITFDCDEETAKMAENRSPERIPSAYMLHHFATKSIGGSLFTSTQIQELFHVQIPGKYIQEGIVRRDQVTPLGYLAFAGNKNYYTRGEAYKKAKMFKGEVIKAE
jgi:hypothetical protein